MIFYDQFGCGHSDRAADPGSYDISLFVEELQVARYALELSDVHLLAHSYGGPIALEYLLREPGPDVRSLTLSNTFASIPALDAGWSRRRGALSPEAQQALEPAVEYEAERYGAALEEFISRFVIAGAPPEPLIRSQTHSGAEVYARMHGPSWFEPNGQWADWDASERLAQIAVPTLVIGGQRDQCVPELAEVMHGKLQQSELAILDTAHLPFYEDLTMYLELVEAFLSKAEAER